MCSKRSALVVHLTIVICLSTVESNFQLPNLRPQIAFHATLPLMIPRMRQPRSTCIRAMYTPVESMILGISQRIINSQLQHPELQNALDTNLHIPLLEPNSVTPRLSNEASNIFRELSQTGEYGWVDEEDLVNELVKYNQTFAQHPIKPNEAEADSLYGPVDARIVEISKRIAVRQSAREYNRLHNRTSTLTEALQDIIHTHVLERKVENSDGGKDKVTKGDDGVLEELLEMTEWFKDTDLDVIL